MSRFTKPGLSHSPSIGGIGMCIDQIDQGALLIGNGVDFDLNTLTAGTGVSIINSAGVITISATGVAYTLPIASPTVLGGIKVGANLSIDGSGVLSASNSYVLPVATASVLGGVKQGSNVTIDGTGVISVAAPYTLPTASASVLGGIKVGSGLSISSGVLSATGSGTVTSVSLTAPAEINVGGTPITGSGTIALTWAAETGNSVLASPSGGGSGTPGFRSLVAADIPNLDTAKITTGTLNLARLSGITTTQLSSTAGIVAGQIASIPNQNASIITAGLLSTARGGTGVDSSAAGNGKLLIGTGSGLALANITAGANITITNASGTITIASTGGGGSSSPLTTKGDIWGFTTVDARQPVGADGTFLAADSSQATGLAYKFPAGIAGVATLSSMLSVDVTMTTANTWYDGPSISLTAGTWHVECDLTIYNNSGGSQEVSAKLWDGTTVINSREQTVPNGYVVGISLAGLAIPSSTATWKASVTTNSGGNIYIKAAAINNAAGNNASLIAAVQLTGAPASGPGALMPAVRATNSGTQSITNGTSTALAFDTTVYDQGTSTAQHSISSNTGYLTCQQAGVYAITANISWDGNSTGTRESFITVNGATVEIADVGMLANASNTQTITAQAKLSLGDYVQIIVWQNSGTTRTITANSNATPCTFAMARIDSGPGAVQPNTKVQLDYIASTDLMSGTSITMATWTDLSTNQTFTVDDPNSVIEIVISGNCQIGTSSSSLGSRVVIDSAAVPINRMIGGGHVATGTYSNVLSGCSTVTLTGLSSGSHTVKVQVISTDVSNLGYCRPVSTPDIESLQIRVLERKMSSSPPSSTPAPAVRCYRSTTQSVSNNTWTTVAYDTNVYDQGTSVSQHSVSTNTSRLTCQQAGVYDIGGVIQWTTNPSSSGLRLLLNGITTIHEVFFENTSGHVVDINNHYQLAVGDYVELQVYSQITNSLIVTGDVNPTFWMARIDSSPGAMQPNTKVQYNGALTATASPQAISTNVWTYITTSATFVVDDANSVVEFSFAGSNAEVGSLTAADSSLVVRLVLDGNTTTTYQIGFTHHNGYSGFENAMLGSGVTPILGLSAGLHTARLQLLSDNQSTNCYPQMLMSVLERKQSSSPPSSTPAPAVRCNNSTNISINNNTATSLTFDSNDYDRGTSTSQHSTSSNTGRLVCQQEGIYDILGQVSWASNSTGLRDIWINHTRGATSTRIGESNFNATSSDDTRMEVSATYYLQVGDYLELYTFQTSGVSVNINSYTGRSPIFSMARVDSGGQGFVPIPMVKTSNYTILNSDCMVVAGANSLTFTLPSASSRAPGMPIVVKNDNFTGTSVARAGSDTVDGATSYSLDGGYNSVTLVGDGISVWRII